MLSDGGKTALGVLANIATGAAGIIADIWQQVADAVACQISMAVGQIIGMITNLVSAFQNLVASVLLLADGILSMAKSWLDWSNFQWELEIEAQNCKDMFSAIAACYLNKMLGPYIE
jgi:phage-related protein